MFRNDLSSIPLLPITVCFSFGIILYVYGWGLIAVIILLFAAIFFLFRNTYFSTLALAGVLGLSISYLQIPLEPDTDLIGKNFVFSGKITAHNSSDAVQTLIVEIDSAGSSPDRLTPLKKTDISVIYPDFIPEFSSGEKIVFSGRPELLTATYDLPDEIDPTEFLIKRHIYLRAFVSSENIYSIREPDGVEGFISRCRTHIVSIIHASDVSPDSKELLTVMLTGDSSGLSYSTRESFTAAGIAHILAISGLHVGIIAFIISIALWPLYITGNANIRWILVCLGLWIFTLLTGLSPSVVRATVMATAYMFSRMLQRNSSPVNSLCLAALLILLFNPEALFQVGFQLSFAAVAAILIFARRLNPVPPRRRIAYNIISYLSVSVSAILGTSLISIFHFHTFPVYFLLSNVIVTLLLPFLLFAAVLLLVSGAMKFEIHSLDAIVDFFVSAIRGTSEYISQLSGSTIDGLYIPAILIVPYLLFLLFLKITLDEPSLKKFLMTGTLLVSVIIAMIIIPETEKENRIYLSRDFRHTELVYSDSVSSLRLITNSPHEPVNVSGRAELRYRDFMAKRKIETLTVDTVNSNSDRMISVGKTQVALISGKKKTFPHQKINFVIVSKGFRDNMNDIINSYKPDTIIISSDIHPKRAARYLHECQKLNQPVIWARVRPWSFGYSSSLKPIVK